MSIADAVREDELELTNVQEVDMQMIHNVSIQDSHARLETPIFEHNGKRILGAGTLHLTLFLAQNLKEFPSEYDYAFVTVANRGVVLFTCKPDLKDLKKQLKIAKVLKS